MAQGDEKDQSQVNQQQELIRIFQLDPVTVSRLLKTNMTEESIRIVAQGDMKVIGIDFNNDDEVARALARIFVDKIMSGMSKFSVTPSTIEEAFVRFISLVGVEVSSFKMKSTSYIRSKISLLSQSQTDRKQIPEVLELSDRIAMILIKAMWYAINEVMGNIVVNMPTEITSQVYKHTVLGIEHLAT